METQGRAFLNNCVLFAGLLRQAGIPIGTDQVLELARALEWIDLGEREQVYHTARSLLIRRHEHLRLFDAIFSRFWRRPSAELARARQTMPRAPRHKRREQPFTIVTYMAYKARLGDPEVDVSDKSGTASSAEILQRKDFSQMTPEELEQIKRLIARLRWQISLRETRRRRRDRAGDQLHMRAIVREAATHGGVPLQLAWQRRTLRQRPLVLIADISGSMEKYARLLLQFLYSVAHSLARVECFVFGTRLTRVTGQLRVRNIDQAIDAAAREVVDWAGGTRIGESLHTFNRQWAGRVLGRGAVVLVISDGWEQGDGAVLARELRFLRRRCHRLIWLNPLAGRAGYQPRVGGMRAALEQADDLLPIHNFQSLANLADQLGQLGRARSR
ncbi:MAG TPA: VWA domain-containing protein [Kouleothrix sp.]|uniref:vWA domain-containing protein n=1 Tax=Kouleothrix sp. TaxID=2779161 RepID=UPI002C21AE5C|nr:VWA domain-containing protein [Kouleothrix sp.]HRC74972.1 VWA domain-containing protein [Kouleothrix sp.]